MASATRPFSRFEWMLAGRYLRPKRKERFISVITIISLIGITLGVATIIIVMSVMNGFRSELMGKILGFTGHITVSNGPAGIAGFVVAFVIRAGAILWKWSLPGFGGERPEEPER